MKLSSRDDRPTQFLRQEQAPPIKPIKLDKKRKKGWQRQLRYIYLRVIRSNSSPKSIARGLAAGVFSGMFPFFGLQTIIALVLAFVLRGNKLVAAIATWISNPITYIPLYMFNFYLGKWLLGGNKAVPFSPMDIGSWNELGSLGGMVLGSLLLGCLVSGTIAGVISYFVGVWLFRRVRKAHYRQRHNAYYELP
ncbi:Protein of unknown function DUF2062 [Thalassoporum mexicanum PCC 7367]|uniref:DUF2062 domain-containing protein n=1 Tax=Thalassoporum mexicanum TaxID=3457544 RepID=UPI00029F8676|nr:DUF2062 domain-containing protein [Pseudanabaena sp. PCC 7367]AFY69516.1 Protein of unknown function DUF2062 [Pseudanabaena sp. PCC 7367]